jgi:hypothetical protein
MVKLLLMINQSLICYALQVTTFNILAPVHRSVDGQPKDRRESEYEHWWRPRAQGVAEYIAEKFVSCSVSYLRYCAFRISDIMSRVC